MQYLKFGWSYSNQTWTASSFKGYSHFIDIISPLGLGRIKMYDLETFAIFWLCCRQGHPWFTNTCLVCLSLAKYFIQHQFVYPYIVPFLWHQWSRAPLRDHFVHRPSVYTCKLICQSCFKCTNWLNVSHVVWWSLQKQRCILFYFNAHKGNEWSWLPSPQLEH